VFDFRREGPFCRNVIEAPQRAIHITEPSRFLIERFFRDATYPFTLNDGGSRLHQSLCPIAGG
jgi:hypothetical protein